MKKTIVTIGVLLGIFLFSLLLRLSTLNEIGRTWDESLYVEQGHKMITLLKKGDVTNSFFYTTYDHPPLIKYLYGLSAQLDVEKVTAGGDALLRYDLTASRTLSSVMFSFGVIVVAIIGWYFFSPVIGIIAAIILAMLPFSLGLSQLVTTESLKILIYPLTMLSYLLLIKKYSVKRLFIAGIITGIALQAKQSDGLLLLIFALLAFLYYRQVSKRKKIAFLNKCSIALVLITLISGIVFILFWPHLLFFSSEIAKIHDGYWSVQFSPYPWHITLAPPEIFFGRLMPVPNFYYIVYFFISIPVIILALFFIGVKKIFHKKDWVWYSLIVWFLVPFALSFYSWRQHGLRYIIEIYPAIALISAIGFDALVSKLTQKETKKLLLFIPVIVYLSVLLWQLKPYYLDYFNELVGGTNMVYQHRLFQQGWWGQGEREAGLYIKQVASPGASIGLALSPEHVFPRFTGLNYQKWSSGKRYDYVIVNYYNIIREGFDDAEIKKKYSLIKEIKADDATLVFIYKWRE
ncbi:MAG: glycosyltransferase family 39 protein [Patescibacteria group bacterium]|mgnify:CR=1 FL=1